MRNLLAKNSEIVYYNFKISYSVEDKQEKCKLTTHTFTFSSESKIEVHYNHRSGGSYSRKYYPYFI